MLYGKARHRRLHARVALVHAQAAEQVLDGESKTHMTQAVEHLTEAIKHGEMNHADVAIEHVNQAITHIKASMSK